METPEVKATGQVHKHSKIWLLRCDPLFSHLEVEAQEMIFPPGGLSGSAVNCRGNNQNPVISHSRNRKVGGKDTGTAAVENWDQALPNQRKQRLSNKAFGTSLLGFIGKATSFILAIKSGWYSPRQPGAGASPGAWPGAWAWQRALPSWESVCHRAVALAIKTLPTCPFTRQDGFSLQQIMFFSQLRR